MYPPGVSGREPQIAGYPVTERKCDNRAEFPVMTPEVYGLLNRLRPVVAASEMNFLLVRRLLQAAEQVPTVHADCPFEDEVEMDGWCWECPVCGMEHDDEPDQPEFDEPPDWGA